MPRDFTWTEKYEEAMSDEHPWIYIGHLDKNEISCRMIKYHVDTTQSNISTHAYQNIWSF